MPVNGDLLLILKSSGMGDGEPDLGEKLIKSFLTKLLESENFPQKIACLNSGIFLTTEGSPVIDLLKEFEKSGSKVVSCTTCLAYFERTNKLLVGQPTDMKETVASMLKYKRILTP